MLVLLVCCATAAGGHYLVQGLGSGSNRGRANFVIAVLVLPMFLVISANAVRLGVTALRHARRRRP